jgi:integrase/recombinase XerD
MENLNHSSALLLDEFRYHLEKLDRSEHSIQAYFSDIRLFMFWFEKNTSEQFAPRHVTEYDVRDWRGQLEKTSLPATVNRKLASISKFMDWLIEKQMITSDPSKNIYGVFQQPLSPKAFSEETYKRMMRKARQVGIKRDIALLEFLAGTGLREGEVAALKYRNIELRERSGWVTVEKGKRRKSRRVPINSHVRHALFEYLEERKNLTAESPVFETRLGMPISSNAIWEVVKKYGTMIGEEKISPHTFRHYTATRLVRNPAIDGITAMTYMGHASYTQISRYSLPNDDDLSRAAETL